MPKKKTKGGYSISRTINSIFNINFPLWIVLIIIFISLIIGSVILAQPHPSDYTYEKFQTLSHFDLINDDDVVILKNQCINFLDEFESRNREIFNLERTK